MLAELQRVGVKVHCAAGGAVPPRQLVPVFHQWIKDGLVPEHVLIDVADYDHVPDGPGVMLVAHEGNFAMDLGGGRLGLMYYRKQPLAGDLPARLRACAHIILAACSRLEQTPALAGRLRFDAGSLELFANDRLHAPNAPDTYTAFQPLLDGFLRSAYGDAACTTERPPDPRDRFGLRIRGPQVDVAQAIARLA